MNFFKFATLICAVLVGGNAFAANECDTDMPYQSIVDCIINNANGDVDEDQNDVINNWNDVTNDQGASLKDDVSEA